MNLKRHIATALSLVLMLGLFAGCGEKPSTACRERLA